MSSLINSIFSSGSGIDVNATVDQLLYAERAPERLMQSQQSQLSVQTNVLDAINGNLSTLLEKVNALKDVSGALNAKSATSSQTGILTATADTTAIPAVHTVVVRNLATTSTFYSNPLATGDTTFATGSFTLQVGTGTPVIITVDSSNNTLNKLAASINNQKVGVTASVISDSSGSRLLLTSNTSGAPGQIAITNNSSGLTLNQGVAGLNASLTVDGVDMSHASNLVSTAIPGVTMNLISAAPNTPVTITIASNTTAVRQAVTDFVSAYNAVASAINLEFKYDDTTKSAGPLAGDASLRSLQSSLLRDVSYSMEGNNEFVNLQSLGIEMQNDGTLTINDSKLDDVLGNHFAEFQSFFQGLSPTGFAHNFSTDLATLTSTTTGPLYVDLAGINNTQDMLTKSIQDFEDRMAVRQKQLIDEYSQIDAILRTFPTTMQEIQAELGTLDQNKNS
jgi:flagellar hook-associated protein 2